MKENTLQLLGRTTVGLGVCTAVGIACKVTRSGWPLLGLMFIPSVTSVTEVVQTVAEAATEE